MRVNVLSFSDVEELYPITYEPFVGFTVHTLVGDILFKKKGKLHIADFAAYGNVLATQVYTKAEMARAHAVQELVRNAGYPSYQEVINLLQDGNFSHLPNLTAKDVRRAYDLFGKSVAFVRGRMTKQAVKRATVDEDLVLEEKNLILHLDVMHIDKNLFLVTVCDPLQLMLQVHIERESHAVLRMALQGQLELLYSKGFKPIRMYVDPQSALKSLETKFPSVSIDVAGAKDYVPKADIKIRRIKEHYRSIKTSLAWNLPMILVKDLVAFAVSRINIKRSATINQTVAPKVLFTSLRLDFFCKELGLAFGDYCKVFDGTDNTSRARSVPCITLYPCNNAAGSWAFFNLITRQRIRRSQWQKMVTMEGSIGQMNGLSKEVRLRKDDVRQDIGETEQVREMQWQEQERATIVRTEEVQPTEGPEQGVPLGSAEGAMVSELQEQECPELVPQEEDDDSDDEMEIDEEEEEEKEEIVAPRQSERIKQGVHKPLRYVAATVKLREGGHNEEKKNAEIKAAKIAEIKQVFEELRALEPVEKKKIPKGIKPLGCHLFTVEKFDASRQHEKYKSRLVSHGNEQDTNLYPNRSSPTVSVHAILTCLALAACNTAYTLAKIDVKGAFIQTEMSGTPVYIKCTSQLRDLILDLYPEYKKYIGKVGVLYCKLLKALYGCVQASKLWYEKVRKFLERLGYVRGEVDLCVFRRVIGEKVYLLTLYVDDILLIAEKTEIERMERAFQAEFRWITMAVGNSHLYIGMKLTVDKGYVVLDMRYYLQNLLEPFDNPQVKVVPGNKETFSVEEAAEKLNLKKKTLFHSTVARLLYLSKRARPDIITVVGFLCTRVREPTVEDWEKLSKLLGYLKGTKGFVMRLKPNALFRVVVYVDASFSAHPDGKSHNGVVVKVGGAPVFFGSKKQKCVSKSPTEAELVALLDNIGFTELFAEFVAFVTNSEQMKPLIYQDSTSVITMVTEGGGITRSKTMHTRMGLVLEAVKEDRIEIRYVNTKGMEADGLSKLGGASFL